MLGNVVDKVQGAYNKVKSVISDIAKGVKFFLTPFGQIIGILVLVIFFIIVFYVLEETISKQFSIWFDNDYAGISTTEDYNTIIGAIGYAGYDSLISEEKVQEYAAFEYAVLMDVAEYLYENQDYLIEETIDSETEIYKSAAFPYGEVTTQYDASDSNITKEKWQEWVALGQDSKPVNSTEIGNRNQKTILGGNRKVVPPRLVYEVASNEYEEAANSLIPYVVIVREDVELNYFFKGIPESELESFEKMENYAASVIPPDIVSSNKSNIEPIMYSPDLNRNNPYLITSTNNKQNVGSNSVQMLEAGIDYDEELYYVEDVKKEIVYKIPLKLLIDRYLPKANLLTNWYMLKDNEFDIDSLMEDIKAVYNAACYGGKTKAEPITATHEILADGTIQKLSSPIVLRGKEDELTTEEVEAISFDDNGTIIRDENGVAKKEKKEIKYANSNKSTFIYFEQFGLETSRFEYMKKYGGEYHSDPAKVPVVKAKIGPKVTNLMCDPKVFDLIPVKKEVKAIMNGIYIMDVKGLRSGLDSKPEKQGFFKRIRAKFSKKAKAE